MDAPKPYGAFEIKLTEESLALIGRATAYEAMAKLCLTTSLKALLKLNHEEWKKRDKLQFDQIVTELHECVNIHDRLVAVFDPIYRNVKEWRDSRNFVVHAVWGQTADGNARAYCHRRNKSGDQVDIVTAVNNCFCLLSSARDFQNAVASMITDGTLTARSDLEPGVAIRTAEGWVKF